MPLSQAEIEMTRIVVDRLLNLKTATSRKDLVTKFKSIDAVDGLINLAILSRINNGVDLVPRALAFEYCNNSEALQRAKASLTMLLNVLQNLYDLTPPRKQVPVSEILSHTIEMYGSADSESVNLGLYLAKEFPAFDAYGWTGAQAQASVIPGFEWVIINEQIVTINPAKAWDDQIGQQKRVVERDTTPSTGKRAIWIEPESAGGGAETEPSDPSNLGKRILEVLDQTYPATLDSDDTLRHRLPEYAEMSSEEWFRALDALQREGLIDGRFLRGSQNKIEAGALLAITPAGREQVRGTRVAPLVSVNVGDRATQAEGPTKLPPADITGDLGAAAASATGPSTHVARDRWTIDDSLGHFPYAYAIYRFLTDRETKPPLAISIQAPWGGGKSSLMRMIQSQLDPEYVKSEKTPPVDSAKATVGDVIKEMEPASEKAKAPQGETGKAQPKTKAAPNHKDHASRFRLPDLKEGGERRVTIWFNAWKYESTAQVWAGLADCIIQQIGERLGPVERELFWFHLQLRRVDIGKVRRRIHEEVLALFFEKILPWVWAYLTGPVLALLVAIVSRMLDWSAGRVVGTAGFVLACLIDLVVASLNLKRARSEVDKNPARVTLGEFVEAPDYRAKLGFIHEVVEDLKRVFRVIPAKYLPMVIFIDDLDRCSPAKVADVVEALNLFLAGEFPDCMFILGIDDEMVAAALDRAHGEVIAKLPPYARSTSIGWRFMDKFVQLPFVVPLPYDSDLTRYLESLLSQGPQPGAVDMDARDLAARAVEQGQDDPSKSQRVVEEVASKKQLSEIQRGALKKEVEILQDMSRNIKNFSDREERIRNLIIARGRQFSNNPREIKRFVNVFRFLYFLRAAREARKEPVPSLEQMCRWIVLSLRWPDVVRWLRRISIAKGFAADSAFLSFENTAGNAAAIEQWQTGVESTFRLKTAEVSWLSDANLYEFLRSESMLATDERLSASSGRGFW